MNKTDETQEGSGKVESATTHTETLPAPPEATQVAKSATQVAVGQCVVDDGTPHTGRAVDGLVCSRHTNRYHADGTLR